MYQRLLYLLSVLFISGTSVAQNNDVMTPADPCYKYDKTAALGSRTNPNNPVANIISKWVHDPTQNNAGRDASGSDADTIGSHGFDQSTYKCYIINDVAFRIRFPNNYDPVHNKYPMMVFLHGAGEAASLAKANNASPDGAINRENQDQLYWGAQSFEQRMNQGEWNGFLLFPQLVAGSAEWPAHIPTVNIILDTLEKYNGLDPDRVISMGLSAGGLGALSYGEQFPRRIATVVTSSPEDVQGTSTDSLLQIPIWIGNGGTDIGPDPSNVFAVRDKFLNAGANIYVTYSTTEGHVMWNTQWNQRDVHGKYILSSYWNAAHKAQPLLYFQTSQFCSGQPISAKMGITPRFAAYEWQMDNGGGFTTIGGAISNTYTATQAGKYRVRFKRLASSAWSDWTPNPVVISVKACSADTAFVEHFDKPTIYTAAAEYKPGSYTCQNGVFTEATDGPGNVGSISQDGAGNTGGRFMLNATTSSCTYTAGDQVWRNYVYPVNVQPNTTYALSFSVANLFNFYTYGSNSPSRAAALTATINGTPLTPVGGVKASLFGNVSWKKYTYTWFSGSASNPEIAIVNNTLNSSWNDFALDEISLVKYKPLPMPGSAFKNFTLWAKANSISGDDNTPVGLWTNNDVNGDNLGQNLPGALPVLKNNASDNINFNPIVKFTAANGQFILANAGFSGTAAHTAVAAYVVAKFNTLSQDDKNILIEGQASSKTVKVTLSSNGRLSWTAGIDPNAFGGNFSNTISTPNNTIEVNKPIVWSFSKDNNNTASGNKQDIRKNGVTVATGSNLASFTGNGSTFGIGNSGQFFDGNIAEVIYLLDSAITPLTQNRIESYLALKYGTTLGSIGTPVNYTASDSTTVFWTANTTFQNDIFGIGTDSASGLVQTTSNSANTGSGDGTGQSAKGNLVLSIGTELLDKRFMMIGNSAASLTQQTIVTGSPLILGSTRVGRNWKVQNTGTVGPVILSFDTTGLGNQAGGAVVNRYSLLISNSGDTTYQNPVSFFTATSASGKKISFAGVTLNNGAVFTIITNNLNLALPAVWLGFTAEAVNGDALLKWKTSDEINVDRYTVEHSFNGVSFSPVGSVLANNNTGENNYTLTHTGLAAGVHYYRIRRIDKDGKGEYSDIKSVKITTTGANVQVRPNPVVGSTLVLAVSVQQTSKTNIQVMGVDGKVIMHQGINLAAGNNLVNLNIASIPPGIYMVQVQLADEVVTRKFIKER